MSPSAACRAREVAEAAARPLGVERLGFCPLSALSRLLSCRGRKLLPPEEKKTLQCLCDRYEIRREHRHRALDDALAAKELYEIFEAQYEQAHPEIFVPFPLLYKAKKQSPATARQKKHLQKLADYHKIVLNVPWETLTKNEASRQIDRMIAQFGRIPEQMEQGESGEIR